MIDELADRLGDLAVPAAIGAADAQALLHKDVRPEGPLDALRVAAGTGERADETIPASRGEK